MVCGQLWQLPAAIRRLGVSAVFIEAMLTAVAPAYLTDTERAAAPLDWFTQARNYATSELPGPRAGLVPGARRRHEHHTRL